ncbi:hypothetical protein GCM10027275_20830 [Rhabdobacter roseus]
MVLASTLVEAQPVVLPLERSLALTVSKEGNERQYVPIAAHVAVYDSLKQGSRVPDLPTALRDSLRRRLIGASKEALSEMQGEFVVSAQLFFDEQGQLSHFFYSLKPFFLQRFDDLFREKLPALLDRESLRVPPGGRARLSMTYYVRNYLRARSGGDTTRMTPEKALAIRDSAAVKILVFSGLGLEKVPEVVYRFPNLEELHLQYNELSEVALDLRRLPRLQKLDLTGNQLTEEGLTLTRNKSLRILNIQRNAFTNVPVAAQHSRRLVSLWIGHNVPHSLGKNSFRGLRKLEDLNLYNAGLLEIPTSIRKLRRLKTLDLYYNELTQLPPALARLRHMEQLAISHNRLETLPEALGKLQKLEKLYAHHNALSTLPTALTKLGKIQMLDIGYNRFEVLPEVVAQLHSLHELDISYNRFSEIPSALPGLKTLKVLHLRGNPFIREKPVALYAPLISQMQAQATEVYY